MARKVSAEAGTRTPEGPMEAGARAHKAREESWAWAPEPLAFPWPSPAEVQAASLKREPEPPVSAAPLPVSQWPAAPRIQSPVPAPSLEWPAEVASASDGRAGADALPDSGGDYPWPELPEPPSPEPADEAVLLHQWERLLRLEREQRGE